MPRLFELLPENSEKNIRAKFRTKAPKVQQQKLAQPPASQPPVRQPVREASISIPDFVALDLETTGLDYKHDRVIEIGAVKFRAGRPGEEFSTLVNPGVGIPQVITELTGIATADLSGAPFFSQVVDKLLEFIGDLPLCGHQVEFDNTFLNEELKRLGRPKLTNDQIDTAAVSRLAIPRMPGYSLSQVTAYFGIALESAHRALCDARASGMAAARLIPLLGEIPARVRRIMAAFCPPSLLRRILFRSAGPDVVLTPRTPPVEPKLPSRAGYPETVTPVAQAVVDKCFDAKGDLSRHLEGFKPRPSQAEMARAVLDALNTGHFLIAEAGTGVGKSLAYLIPAAHWAMANNCRILVSAHTRNAADQLVLRDLPMVAKLVGEGFTYGVLKGRANYLCLSRWHRLVSGELGNLSPRERFGILPLIRWAEETSTGDIEEQNMFNRKWFAKVWSMISAESHDCAGRRCPYNQACYLQRARRRATSSHVVIINHAIFFSEICAESSFLGSIGSIIFDEAHHLESCGHQHLRTELDTNRVNRYLEMLDNMLRSLQERYPTEESLEEVKHFKALVKRLRASSQEFLSDCAQWVLQSGGDVPTAFHVAYRDRPFEQTSGLANFDGDLREMQDCLLSIQRMWRQADGEQSEAYTDVVSCAEWTSQLKADLAYLSLAVTDDHVFWVEGNRERGWVKLCGVPLDLGAMLGPIWQRLQGCAVFTSATLTADGSIDYFRQKVGLTKGSAVPVTFARFASPFSPDQMVCCSVDGALEPEAAGYGEYVAGVLVRLCERFEKNVLALFTSMAMLSDVYNFVKADTRLSKKVTVLGQHVSGSRQVMLDQFKKSRPALLLGADSFWEGIDAPGQECEIVVVARLPFLVPTHPLTQALAQRYEALFGDSFIAYTVPEAVIRFRQGAGRLIRTLEDRGAFIVLDNRVQHKRYGKMFTGALESAFIFTETVDEMLNDVARFFAAHGTPAQ